MRHFIPPGLGLGCFARGREPRTHPRSPCTRVFDVFFTNRCTLPGNWKNLLKKKNHYVQLCTSAERGAREDRPIRFYGRALALCADNKCSFCATNTRVRSTVPTVGVTPVQCNVYSVFKVVKTSIIRWVNSHKDVFCIRHSLVVFLRRAGPYLGGMITGYGGRNRIVG